MIILLARKAAQTVDHQEVNFALVCATELEQRLQLRPVGCLRALALFPEALEDFQALALAVVFAGFELRGETYD
jgi:hypothetical protein